MTALVFEILGLCDLLLGTYYYYQDRNDIMNWLFFLLVSVIMYINAARYDKESE